MIIINFFTFLLFGIISFLMIYTLGYILYFPFASKYSFESGSYKTIDFSYYTKIFFGVIGIISILASYITLFKTIFIIFPIIYLVSLLYYRKSIKIDKNYLKTIFFDIKKILLVSIIWNIVLLFYLFKFQFLNKTHYFLISNDVTYYTNLAKGMFLNNVEAVDPWNKIYNNSHMIAYHYSDLWLSGIFLKLFDFLKTNEIYYYICYPLFTILTIIPIAAIIEFLYNKNLSLFKTLIIYLFAFLISNYFGYFPKKPLGFLNTTAVEIKTFNYIFLISYAIFFYLNKKYNLFYLALGSIPVFDFVYYPIIMILFGFCLLFTFVFYIKLKQIKFNFHLLIIPLFAMFLFCFYSIFGSLTEYDIKLSLDLFSLNVFFTNVFEYISRLVITSPHYFLITFLILINIKKIEYYYLYLFFIFNVIILFSILLTSFFKFYNDQYWQFLRAINPILALYIVFIPPIINFYRNKNNFLYKVIIFIASIIFVTQSLLGILSQVKKVKIETASNTKYSFYEKSEISTLLNQLNLEHYNVYFFTDKLFEDPAITYGEYNFSFFTNKSFSFFEYYDSRDYREKTFHKFKPYLNFILQNKNLSNCEIQEKFIKKPSIIISKKEDSTFLQCKSYLKNADSLFLRNLNLNFWILN